MKKKIKVLIANDNEKYGEELKNELEQTKDIEVLSVVGTVKDAFNEIIKYQPEVVILDVILSGGNGLQIIEDVEKCRLAHKVRYFVISSISQKDIIEKAKVKGVEEYYIKPFNIEQLSEKILNKKKDNTSIFERKKIEFVEVDDKTNENNVEIMVSNLLHELGIYSNLKGYDLIKESVLKTLKDSAYVKNITKKLYPTLAIETHASPQAVERSIRSCIERAWERGDVRTIEQLFGRTDYEQKRPTNSQFIAVIAEKIRLDRKVEQNKQLV